MKLHQQTSIPLSAQTLWPHLADVQQTAFCLPGVESVKTTGTDIWISKVKVNVVFFSVSIDAVIKLLSSDPAQRHMVLSLDASDKRLDGGLSGTFTIRLEQAAPEKAKLLVDGDVTLFGNAQGISESMIQKRAQETLQEFAENLRKRASA